MSRPVQVELPTGDVVWAHVETAGPTDIVAGKAFKLDADELRATVRGLSASLRDALDDLAPDHLQIEFGLELAVKSGKITSIVAEAGAKATVKVVVGWSADSGPPTASVVGGEEAGADDGD